MKKLMRQISVIISIVILLTAIQTGFADTAGASGVSVSSASAAVIDFETGILLFGHNEEAQRVPASMLKMVAAYVVYDAIRDGRTTPDSTVTISLGVSEASRDREYQNIVLPVGSTPTVRELLEAAIVYSACAATVALGEGIFGSERELVNRMNRKASNLGIEAIFHDSWGGSPDNRISALGMALMSRAFIMDYPEVLATTARTFARFNGLHYPATNSRLGVYRGLDGFKTGYTDPAGFCFIGTALRSGRRLVSVVMGATQASRYPDTEAMLDYGFANADAIIAELLNPPEDPLPPDEPPPLPVDPPVFRDVSPDDWEYNNVLGAYMRGLMRGMGPPRSNGDIVFSPTGLLTRAEVAQILYNAFSADLHGENTTPIADAKAGAWYLDPINWLVGNGIAELAFTGDGAFFYPNQPATRYFMAETLFLIAHAKGVTLPELTTPVSFPDVAEEYEDVVAALQRSKVIEGYPNGRFMPYNDLLRRDAAALMLRFTNIEGLEAMSMR